MTEEEHEFQVSREELVYLKRLASHDESLRSLLRFWEDPHGRGVIRLSLAKIEQLRDCLTKQLALVGFDKNYSPNEQGQMLEKLIDRFYLR